MPMNEDGINRESVEYWMGYTEALTAILQRCRHLLVRSNPNELTGVIFIIRTLRDLTDAALQKLEGLAKNQPPGIDPPHRPT